VFGCTRRAFRSQCSGHLSIVALPVRLHTSVIRSTVRSSFHDQDERSGDSPSMSPRGCTAYLISMTCGDLAAPRGMAHGLVLERENDDCKDLQKIGPKQEGKIKSREVRAGRLWFFKWLRGGLHVARNGRSLQTHHFSNDLNCLATCAAFAPCGENESRVTSGHHPLSGRDRSSRRCRLRRRRPPAHVLPGRKGGGRSRCGGASSCGVVPWVPISGILQQFDDRQAIDGRPPCASRPPPERAWLRMRIAPQHLPVLVTRDKQHLFDHEADDPADGDDLALVRLEQSDEAFNFALG
jgi:hypothetical protein